MKLLNDNNYMENISCRFLYNGHIIGASLIELKMENKLFVFSGDIGREKDELFFAPKKLESADILFVEYTYGNKLHPENGEEKLAEVINHAAQNQGTIIIPSFAEE